MAMARGYFGHRGRRRAASKPYQSGDRGALANCIQQAITGFLPAADREPAADGQPAAGGQPTGQ
jgi:hypothetical protein